MINSTPVKYSSLGDTVYFSLGKVIENNSEKVIIIYSQKENNILNYLEYMDETKKDTLTIYDFQTGNSFKVRGRSPFIGNGNLACFTDESGNIRVIKYEKYGGSYRWIYYPDLNSQNYYSKGVNAQIFYNPSISTLIFEKDKQIYMQKILDFPLPSVKLTMMPEDYDYNLKPNFTVRRDYSGLYAQIIHSFRNSLLIFREYKISNLDIPRIALIEENIPLFDIPPNNSKRLFLKNDSLNILYSKNNSIYDAILKDKVIKKIFLGYGKNPAGFLYKNNLYSIWAYNDTTTLEKIEFTKVKENSSPYLAYTSSNTYLWGIGSPDFYIKDDTAYTVFETSYGPTYHPPLPGPYPSVIKIWAGKLLNVVKFPINNPYNYQIIYQDFIQTFPETLNIPVKEFYHTVVPGLISPSIFVDKYNFKNIVWDGTNKYLKIYKIGSDTIIKTFYPQNHVFDPYVSKENSFIRFIWVEDSSKIFSSYTFLGKGISEKELIYEGNRIKDPFIDRNYIVFVENDGEFDNLCFGEIKIPFEKEILFSGISIRSPQMLFDKNKFHITFYSGDTIYNLYRIEKEVSEVPPDIVIDFGKEVPSPLTIYREGYISLGIEDYKNLDYGDSLIYEVPIYSASKVKIKFEAYLDREVKEKIYINNHPLGVWHIKENNYEIYEKQIVPPVLDSILKIKIEKKQGDKVYLGKLSVYIEEKTTGGPQGFELKPVLRFSLNVLPNVIKDRGIFIITIPDKQKVDLSIYDVSGRKVLNIINKELEPGIYKIDFKNK
ncbi:MAG: hypothetical protein ABIN73_02710, partial [candidate division WOR-3 bacterium]